MQQALGQFLRQFILLVAAFGAATLFVAAVSAWTGPSGTPPNNNVSAPINIGSATQIKSGSLGVTTLLADEVSVANTSAADARAYVGYESGTDRGLWLLSYGSAHATYPDRAVIYNYRDNSTAIGGYIDFQPVVSTTFISPPNGNSGTVRTYGKLTPTQMCLGTDCRTAWESAAVTGFLNRNWQTVTRAFNTSYQNTLAYPIEVAVTTNGNRKCSVEFDVTNAAGQWLRIGRSNMEYGTSISGQSSGCFVTATVPPGKYYRATTAYGSSLSSWVELR